MDSHQSFPFFHLTKVLYYTIDLESHHVVYCDFYRRLLPAKIYRYFLETNPTTASTQIDTNCASQTAIPCYKTSPNESLRR